MYTESLLGNDMGSDRVMGLAWAYNPVHFHNSTASSVGGTGLDVHCGCSKVAELFLTGWCASSVCGVLSAGCVSACNEASCVLEERRHSVWIRYAICQTIPPPWLCPPPPLLSSLSGGHMEWKHGSNRRAWVCVCLCVCVCVCRNWIMWALQCILNQNFPQTR